MLQQQEKKEGRDMAKKLEATICTMEKELARNYSNDVYQDICKYKFQLHDIYTKKAEYALFRLRTRFYEGGEKAGKLLARQLKQQNASNIIPAIKKGNTMVSMTKEINEVFQNFYNQLYTSSGSLEEGKMTQFFSNIMMPKLDVLQSESLDCPITQEEVIAAIASMKPGKSPGVDGLP